MEDFTREWKFNSFVEENPKEVAKILKRKLERQFEDCWVDINPVFDWYEINIVCVKPSKDIERIEPDILEDAIKSLADDIEERLSKTREKRIEEIKKLFL